MSGISQVLEERQKDNSRSRATECMDGVQSTLFSPALFLAPSLISRVLASGRWVSSSSVLEGGRAVCDLLNPWQVTADS